MIVIVTGSRNWRHPHFLRAVMNAGYTRYGMFDLYHGACPTGADAQADAWARTVPGMHIERFPADWTHGSSAGPERNERMIMTALRNGSPDGQVRCVAFHRSNSRGTQHAINYARKLHIPTTVWTEADIPQAPTLTGLQEGQT